MRRRPGPSILQIVEGTLTCRVCGDVVGVYEPVLLLGDSSSRMTSLAREPDVLSQAGLVVHRGCVSRSRLGDSVDLAR
jgi:hypothetical protein